MTEFVLFYMIRGGKDDGGECDAINGLHSPVYG